MGEITSSPKGSLHIGSSCSIGALEANENQRNWSKDDYIRENKKPDHWYDYNRRHLNFEIDSKGRIQPIGTSKPIHERFNERLAELGAKELNPEAKQQPNRIVKFVLSGDHDVMMKLAFGNQKVDLSHKDNPNNNKLHREKGIEKWAFDVYKWMADRYGSENIVGFDVHLDETTAHIHASFIPVVNRVSKKTGLEREVISYKGYFGKDIAEGKERIAQLHTDLFDMVNRNYGLNRGDSVEGRNVKHYNKSEYFYKLKKQIKALETMKANKERELQEVQNEKAKLDAQLSKKMITAEEYNRNIKELGERERSLIAIIEKRRQQISEADAKFGELTEDIVRKQVKLERVANLNEDMANNSEEYASLIVKGAIVDDLAKNILQLCRQRGITLDLLPQFEGTPLAEILSGNFSDVMVGATNLLVGYLNACTSMDPSSGGGGGGSSPSDDDKKKDDEDWKRFAQRMIGKSHAACHRPKFRRS